MAFLLLKDLPRYDCLIEAAKTFPDLDPSATEAYLHLLRCGDMVAHVGNSWVQRCNLSAGRFTVLMLLFNKCGGPLAHTPAELADMAGVTRATMTGLIDTLERDGMVTRHPDPVDRRMMSVALTEKGIEHLGSMLPEHFRRTAAVMSTLTTAERRTLVDLLGKIMEQAMRIEPRDTDRSAAVSGDVATTAAAAS
ncbi:LOW QUALITY PROTEIN: transcriptional regulator [Opitutaceae bacterium TAV1]|nr:LOW QUALITY PROTEIN: transcriptional regulator [Opitutaceae bacterium TAV1]